MGNVHSVYLYALIISYSQEADDAVREFTMPRHVGIIISNDITTAFFLHSLAVIGASPVSTACTPRTRSLAMFLQISASVVQMVLRHLTLR